MEMNTDEKTLHRLEGQIETVIYPGTEIMSDVGSTHFAKAGGKSGRVLVPQPSLDPHDPLNWSPFWKGITLTLSTAVSFAQGMGPLSLAPMFPQLMEAYDRSLQDVIQFTGVCILVLGFSNFIWVPIQTTYGRRPVVLLSTLICVVSNIWRATATTYASQMGACILNGIGAGPAETSQPAVITDITFLHERGAWNTLYFTFYFGSLMIGPIIAGPIALHASWRDFWWLNVALHGVILVLSIFLFPETKYHRPSADKLQGKSLGSSTSTSPQESDNEKIEKEFESKSVDYEVTATSIYRTHARTEIQPTMTAAEASSATATCLHRGRPSRAQFKFWTKPRSNPFEELAQAFWIPWKILLFPIVEFAAFLVSWPASIFLMVNLTQSHNFAAAPYNLGSQSIGFTDFAMLVGVVIGLATNGPLSDWVADRATRKNHGVREPEMRLPALIPYVVIMILCNLICAFGYQYKWSWKPIVIVGYTCAGIQVSAIPAIASTYAVDSYKPIAGSIFVAITINKNVWGYGYSKFLIPWVERSGYLPPILLNMGLACLWCSFAVIFFFYGKTFRGWTARSSVHRVE